MADHVHILIGIKPDKCISDLVRDIKSHSSKFITEQGFVKGRFEWQEGFGVFSYSHTSIHAVYNYILNQQAHHKRQNFAEEYLELLETFRIEYDRKYIFQPLV
jgi:REP element-mobilizing transposase RayT